MTRSPRIGLLPLYLKLYDDVTPERRADFMPFLEQVVEAFGNGGVDVTPAEVCRVKPEFEQAVKSFEEADVDLIVTLHLAYSPSLESIDPLCDTSLPIFMLDTTMDASFGQDVDPSRIMYNHGIHGVQDLACMLRRRRKAFRIAAGHFQDSNVIGRACQAARGARAARRLHSTNALRIGEPFAGMGDFAVDETVLASQFGMRITQRMPADLLQYAPSVTEEAVQTEMAADLVRFDADIDPAVHERSVRAGLVVRAALEDGGHNAFSANFLAFDTPEGALGVVPFLEASKAMSRGVGYAGEGDVFTAALVGALASAFDRTTFTEIFCPDWSGGSIFLSHMGEINPDVVEGKARLCEKPYPYTDALNPAMASGAPAPGPAVFVNLAPGPDDTFGLIAAPVTVLADAVTEALRDSVRGWIRPTRELEEFLELYSQNGGTHHSALVHGDCLEGIIAFADYAGLDCVVI
ncbi:MAG: hypothetical protein KAI66_04695 [Lentisphaeria bacterium]|nr:hypothetical protein [Lentisphaeria bacterium]